MHTAKSHIYKTDQQTLWTRSHWTELELKEHERRAETHKNGRLKNKGRVLLFLNSSPVSIHSSYIPFQVLLGGEPLCEPVNGRLWECLSFH